MIKLLPVFADRLPLPAPNRLGPPDRAGDVYFSLRSLPVNFFRTVLHMATPTPLLAMVDPGAAARRLERRAAWRAARAIGYGWHRRTSASPSAHPAGPDAPLRPNLEPMTDPASRPVREAMAPADLASVEATTKGAAQFFPRQSARVLAEIGHDAPVGAVRDSFKELVGDIDELRATPRDQLLAAVAEKRATR
jgi:hypothetical protein